MKIPCDNQSNNFSWATRRQFAQHTFAALLSCIAVSAVGQPTGVLYDPEPPADSGYVRVMLLADMGKISVLLNGKPRVASLENHQASDYMVVPPGQHRIDLIAAGKVVASGELDVVRATSVTVVFTAIGNNPLVFIDKTGRNRLKSMLSVYQLASKNESLDVLTKDGTTKVFSDLAYGMSSAIQVNPVSIELMTVKSGTITPLAPISLNMAATGSYSIFLTSSARKKTTAIVIKNKIERYMGK